MPCVPAIIVHGGAGKWSSAPSDRREAARRALMESAEAGLQIMEKGGTSVEAIVEAISHMESSGVFNSGKGSVANSDGFVEMDAGLMDGETLDSGAVASLRGIENPIRVALLVMKKTPHVILSGEGARRFALSNGFSEDPFLLSKRDQVSHRLVSRSEWRGDTVGAAAVDQLCHTAAGASTGGISGKMPGRIGDSPVPGAGFYANHFAAAAATGIGELILILGISRKIVEEATLLGSVKLSGRSLLEYTRSKFKDDTFGVIGIDIRGEYAAIYNTESMPYAYFKKGMESPLVGGFPAL
ncbi:MAG: isoaspartyl peptidase/L-asparaginase [Desulfurococcales archaeon]